MIKRILGFKSDDWRHISWLMKQHTKALFRRDWDDARICRLCIKLHLSYDCHKIEK